MFPRDSAFRQERIQRERAADLLLHKLTTGGKVELAKGKHEYTPDPPPFEHWHHDLVTVDTLLDQKPPEIQRARALLQEVADEIHSQFESIR